MNSSDDKSSTPRTDALEFVFLEKHTGLQVVLASEYAKLERALAEEIKRVDENYLRACRAEERVRCAQSAGGTRELVNDDFPEMGARIPSHGGDSELREALQDMADDLAEHLQAGTIQCDVCRGHVNHARDLLAGKQSASADSLTPLERYALAVLDAHREEIGDLDGAFLQDEAEKYGLLESVSVTEPCGELCRCAEYDDFPQECLRIKAEFMPKMSAHRKAALSTPERTVKP